MTSSYRKPAFSIVHTKKIRTLFLKKIHSGTAFSKSSVSSARNRRWRVDGKLKRRKISVFKNTPICVNGDKVLKLKFGLRGSFKFGCQLVSIATAKANERSVKRYLTIIPRARMGSESIAREAEGRMGYWLRGHEGERNNCFSKIQLVGQKCRDKTTFSWLKLDVNPFLPPKIRRSSLLGL